MLYLHLQMAKIPVVVVGERCFIKLKHTKIFEAVQESKSKNQNRLKSPVKYSRSILLYSWLLFSFIFFVEILQNCIVIVSIISN